MEPLSLHVDFGGWPVGWSHPSSPRTIAIVNNGLADLNFTGAGVEIAGAHSGDFAVTAMPVISPLPPLQRRDVKVVFYPSALGETTATLKISTDDPDDPNVLVILAGTGIEPPPTQASGHWNLLE